MNFEGISHMNFNAGDHVVLNEYGKTWWQRDGFNRLEEYDRFMARFGGTLKVKSLEFLGIRYLIVEAITGDGGFLNVTRNPEWFDHAVLFESEWV